MAEQAPCSYPGCEGSPPGTAHFHLAPAMPGLTEAAAVLDYRKAGELTVAFRAPFDPAEAPVYTYYVTIDHEGRGKNVYTGDSPADAMAAWSRAVGAGNFYPVLEAVLQRRTPRDNAQAAELKEGAA